jgi:uncharacterized protein with PQ loop repeat
MSPETTQLLGAAATLYGLGGALSVLLQARRMHLRGTSGDVSVRFFAVYVGGFAVWLLYGLAIGDVPIIVVHAVGLLCGTVTLAVALRLRGPAAVAATSRSVGEDRARARPGRPFPRELEHGGLPLGVRVGSVERIGTLGCGPVPTSEKPLKANFAEHPFHALG